MHCSAIRCAKFGVAVVKASMLELWGFNLPWVYMHCSTYRSGNFGVVVFKASILD